MFKVQTTRVDCAGKAAIQGQYFHNSYQVTPTFELVGPDASHPAHDRTAAQRFAGCRQCSLLVRSIILNNDNHFQTRNALPWTPQKRQATPGQSSKTQTCTWPFPCKQIHGPVPQQHAKLNTAVFIVRIWPPFFGRMQNADDQVTQNKVSNTNTQHRNTLVLGQAHSGTQFQC